MSFGGLCRNGDSSLKIFSYLHIGTVLLFPFLVSLGAHFGLLLLRWRVFHLSGSKTSRLVLQNTTTPVPSRGPGALPLCRVPLIPSSVRWQARPQEAWHPVGPRGPATVVGTLFLEISAPHGTFCADRSVLHLHRTVQ